MIRRHHRLRVHIAAQVTSLMISPTHPPVSLSMPALVTGNQNDGGFYKGFFRSLLKPLSPPPDGSGVVTDAEPLTRLRDLGYQPRKIARQIDPATWEWFGDLNDIVER